jgi:predicted SnoaL-like aldol condensation-catalyzing enzyme
MAGENKQVVQAFFEEVVNARRFDRCDVYLSKDHISHNSPYVGMGFTSDFSSGVHVVVGAVAPGGPSEGVLQLGDVILSVQDGEYIWDTYTQLRKMDWGPGCLGTSVHLKVQRGVQELEFDITRGMIQGFDLVYTTLVPLLRWFYEEEFTEFIVKVDRLIEEDDLVAYMVTNSGMSVQFKRQVVWMECGFCRVRDGKIVEWWNVEDTLSQEKQLGYRSIPPEG